jgi:two-component system, chemotaxis family, chemotaxis protein CheY
VASILIVDDAMFMRVTLRNILTKEGHEIVGESDNGEDAVARYLELRPDIVTMDITMPKMDGIAAVRGILAADPTARIVMCTAMGQKNMVLEAIQAGAKDFIVKPFQPERVIEGINKALGV